MDYFLMVLGICSCMASGYTAASKLPLTDFIIVIGGVIVGQALIRIALAG